MLLRKDGAASSNPPHQRQDELGQALQRQGKLMKTGFIDAAHITSAQANAA